MCGIYSRAAFIRGRRLIEGGIYSRAAFNAGKRLFEGNNNEYFIDRPRIVQ